MAQYTIYVVDALAERVKQFRDRLQVSPVCARALEQEVERLEAEAKGQPNVQGIVERLREERRQGSASTQWGRQEAVNWLKSASYAQVREAAQTGLQLGDITSIRETVRGLGARVQAEHLRAHGSPAIALLAEVTGSLNPNAFSRKEFVEGFNSEVHRVWALINQD